MTIHQVAPFREKARGGTRAAAVCLAAGVLLTAAPAPAAQVSLLSMSVSPIRVEHAIQPGEEKTALIVVENNSDRRLRARVAVADWYLKRDGAPVFVKRGELPPFSMSEWIEVNPSEFELSPGEFQTIRYTVTAPAGTAVGGYRAAILIDSLPDFEDTPRANVTYVTGRVGVILYNRVGNAPVQAEVVGQEVVTDPRNAARLAVRLSLRNRGRTHFRVSGRSRILDSAGTVLRALAVEDAVVLPQSERDILVWFERPADLSEFTVLSRLDVGLPEWLEVETHVGAVAAGP